MSAAAAPGRPVTASRRTSRFTALWIRDPLIVIGVGAGVGALLAVEDSSGSLFLTLSLSSLTGLLILLAARFLFTMFEARVRALGRGAGIAARAALLAASGVIAWTIVQAVAVQFWHVHFGHHVAIYILVTTGLAVAVGFVLYSFDVVRSRLAASVARLKEIEFAEKELLLARELQSRLLPPPEIAGEGYRIAARNLAARLVAGDFYDSFLLPDGAVGAVVGDVAGKGMAAALIMASVKAMLPLVAAGRSAADTLREVNRRLAAELAGREFVALAFARFEPAAGRVELANAGLPDPYLLAAGRPPAPQSVPGPRLPLGVRREVEYGSLSLRLAPGDRLLLLTDGLAEAPTRQGEPLGYAALAELLAEGSADVAGNAAGAASAPGSAEAADAAGAGSTGTADTRGEPLVWIDSLLDRVRAATQAALEDDWTALLLERGPLAEGAGAGPAAGIPGAGAAAGVAGFRDGQR